MKTTIEMAREAGFAIDVSTDPNSPPSWWGAGHDDKFKAFAAIAADAEAKRIHDEGMVTVGHMREQIEEATRRASASWTLMCEKMVTAEREACAAVGEEQSTRWALPMERASYKDMLEQCAAAIRARSM
jgi:hypothetical protein